VKGVAVLSDCRFEWSLHQRNPYPWHGYVGCRWFDGCQFKLHSKRHQVARLSPTTLHPPSSRGRLNSSPPPSLQKLVGGEQVSLSLSKKLILTNNLRLWSCPPPHSPSLASNVSRRGVFIFSHHTSTHPPSLASNASRRGHF
jgi:hypothetical protein